MQMTTGNKHDIKNIVTEKKKYHKLLRSRKCSLALEFRVLRGYGYLFR